MGWRGFASDNYAGVHPEIMQALARVNEGHAVAYGDDDVTALLEERVREHFGDDAHVFPVFNGTGANVVSLQAMCRSWEAVICAESAHINVDEGGAPEKVAAIKLWTVSTPDGLLTPDIISQQAVRAGDVHRAQQRVVSITQSTELGTCYDANALAALVDYAHGLGLLVHLDGARLANAAAAMGVSLAEASAGVDAISFGGTKNGAMGAEAIIVRDPELARTIPFVRKSAMQLSSKMRFVSAQLAALLADDLWRRNAEHANAMAARLADGARGLGVEIMRPVQANAVFARLPAGVTERLQRRFRFYVWDEFTGEVRWMCSWDTSTEDVDSFVEALGEELSA